MHESHVHSNRLSRGRPLLLLGFVLAVLCVLLLPTTSSANTTPYRDMGKTTVTPSHPQACCSFQAEIQFSYKGRLPKLKKREYMWFTMAGPGTSPYCASSGQGMTANASKPKLKKDSTNPEFGYYGATGGLGVPAGHDAQWCPGKWLVQYQVMTPFKDSNGYRAWKPRLIISYKSFRISK